MNKRLRKIAILSALSASLLTGCSNKGQSEDLNNTYTSSTIESTTQEEVKTVSNQTIVKIYEEYKEKKGEDIDISNLEIIEFDKPIYMWKKGDKYIYDYRVNGYNNEEYTYVEPGYCSKIYAVVDGNTPICALGKKDDKIFNIKVTYIKDNEHIYEPSEDYIYIDEPNINNFNELKNADEYINTNEEYREPAIQKEQKEIFILK